jgi:Tfp pilus assembly protein PilF
MNADQTSARQCPRAAADSGNCGRVGVAPAASSLPILSPRICFHPRSSCVPNISARRRPPSAFRFPLFLCLLVLLFSGAGGGGDKLLELRGRILTPEGKPLPARPVVSVALNGVAFPHTVSQLVMGGRFRFTKLQPGTYTLQASVPGFDELNQSIEVSPGLAKKNRVEVQVRLSSSAGVPARRAMTSVRELAIPQGARKEMDNAFEALRAPGGARTEEVIRHLERAIEIEPRFLEAINVLGTVFYRQREFKKAEECFRRALAIDASAYEPLVNLGGVLINLWQFDEALRVNRQAVAARPGDALAHAQLGAALMMLGNDQAAIASLLRAKQLDPNHFSLPQLRLAEIYIRLGRNKDAAAELQDFLKRHPDDPAAPEARDWLNRQRQLKDQSPRN